MTLGEAEWLELRLEVDGLGCGWDDNRSVVTMETQQEQEIPKPGSFAAVK